ncbi:MAG: SDR family oxidoreductase [Deltaproteobacteria bacterium]|nr:SDR family oxidoreductase [Deltaproteobacteria bacterium]MBN2674272.1 SDR family oxidoreductase [Deltaproteobacteria bacterium]
MSQKCAFVTGAGSGIGRATALRLATQGYRVYAVGRSVASVEETAAMTEWDRIVPIGLDVLETSDFANVVGDITDLHALVLNAGICRQAQLDDGDATEVWHQVIQTNLTGAWNTVSALQSRLVSGAKIVTVSSGLGKLGRAGYTAYAATKHGLIGMVKCLALELAPRAITVNAVCPGWVDTAMAHADLERSATTHHQSVHAERAAAENKIPLGRFVQPEEVARLISWLLSDDAGAITGQSYNISCGEFTA